MVIHVTKFIIIFTTILAGKRLSPVNISTADVVQERVKKPLDWSPGFNKLPKSCVLTHDGKNLKFTANTPDPLILTGGNLPLTYEFQHLTFRWGADDTKGSEHTIDGKSLPLEMMVVFKRTTEKVGTDEFVIVSQFFKVSKKNKNKNNKILQNIVEMVVSCTKKLGSPVNVKPFLLSALIPTNDFSYYTYKGSLTYEPYTESVTWIINPLPMPISLFQLKTFKKAGEIDAALNTRRDIVEVGDRIISLVKPNQGK